MSRPSHQPKVMGAAAADAPFTPPPGQRAAIDRNLFAATWARANFDRRSTAVALDISIEEVDRLISAHRARNVTQIGADGRGARWFSVPDDQVMCNRIITVEADGTMRCSCAEADKASCTHRSIVAEHIAPSSPKAVTL